MAELQLAFQSYESRADQFSQQKLVNLFWERGVEGTKSQGILYKRPGLKDFATVGAGPIRGVWTMKGVPFIVSGSKVFTLNSAGVTTDLGTLTGSGLVDMSDNGEQVAIVSGQNGFIAAPLAVFNTSLSVDAVIGEKVIVVDSISDMSVGDSLKITLDDTSIFTSEVVAFNVTTSLSFAAVTGTKTISVSSKEGMQVGDVIVITLDNASTFSTTVDSFVGSTDLTVALIATDTVLTVTTELGMNVGDVINITKDDTSIFNTTIASLSPLTISDPIDGPAAIGNLVEFSNSGTVTLTDLFAGGNAAASNKVVYGGSTTVLLEDNVTGAASSGQNVEFQTPTLQIIDDVNFRAVSSVTFQDGFFIWTEADTDRSFSSPLLNGLGPYDALDFVTAEYESDDLVKAFSDHDDLFLFGTDTVEPWIAGGTAFPFVPNSGTVMEVGLLARNAVAKIDNGVMFFGNAGDRGGRSVWRIQGYSAVRMSTHALESIWEKAGDVSDSYAISFRMEGHEFFALTIPDLGTYVYDASTQKWCEWKTFEKETWEIIGFSRAFDKNLVASRTSNKVYELSFDNLDDAGEILKWEAVMVPISSPDNYRSIHKYIRIDMQSGVGLRIGQGSNPQLFISWANEDNRFGNLHLLDIGKIGETKTRVQKHRLGQARSRTYKIEGTDPVVTAILGVWLEINEGVS